MGRIITDNTGFFNSKTKIHEDGQVEVFHTQDIEHIIDQNKRDQADRDFKNGMSQSGDMKHVARVPLIVWEQWWIEEKARRGHHIPMYGKEMNEVVRIKLNDSDNQFLRTGLGEIGKGRQ